MARRKGGRTTAAVAISAAAHVLVLAVVALQTPILRMVPEDTGPPEPIIPVLLMPKTPPLPTTGKPEPIRLHRRPQPFTAPPPIAPLPVPPEPARTPARGPATVHPAPLPQTPKMELRTTLRGSPVGCADPEAAGLTRAERDRCYEQLGKGAKGAPFPGLGLNAAKQSEFDRVGARKLEERREKEGPVPPGINDTMGKSQSPSDQTSDSNAPPHLGPLPP